MKSRKKEDIGGYEENGATIDAPHQPDGTLTVNEDGLLLPDWLVGYVGEFRMRTPNVTGEMETTEQGLSDRLSTLGAIPEEGTYNSDLRAGQMALKIPGEPEYVYKVVDEAEEHE